jgi:hypothetical protein
LKEAALASTQHQTIHHHQEVSRSNMKLLFILFTAAAAIASVS